MTDTNPRLQPNHVELAAEIAAAYVRNNSVPVAALHELLTIVHAAISGLTVGGANAAAERQIEKPTAAKIKNSITADALVSFEDGKRYKTLRRHLKIRGLSPEAYRAKHGLPPDYPMTSASYSAQRSQLAREIGLGRQRESVSKATSTSREDIVSKEAPPASGTHRKAGRPRKAAV